MTISYELYDTLLFSVLSVHHYYQLLMYLNAHISAAQGHLVNAGLAGRSYRHR